MVENVHEIFRISRQIYKSQKVDQRLPGAGGKGQKEEEKVTANGYRIIFEVIKMF